jgi:hypothetical protein
MNKKIAVSGAIGTLALVLLLVNYQIMEPMAQQQYSAFKSVLNSYGLDGDYEYYGSVEEAMRNGGLQFNYEWQRLYDAYNLTTTEIYAVSIICILVAVLSFSYAFYKWQRKPQQKLNAYIEKQSAIGGNND